MDSSSHPLVTAVRVASTSLRAVVREGDMRTFEAWRGALSRLRGVSPSSRPSPTASPGKTEGSLGSGREGSGAAFAAALGHAGETGGGWGGGGRGTAVAVEGGERRGPSGGGGDRAAEAEESEEDEGAGPPLPPVLVAMLSPVFSFAAAFESLRLEVTGDEAGVDGVDDGAGGGAETGCFGGAGFEEKEEEEERRGSPGMATEGPGSAVDGGSGAAAAGRKSRGAHRAAELADPPAAVVGGDGDRDGATQPDRREGLRSRWPPRQQQQQQQGPQRPARRQHDAPYVVAELKGVHAEARAVVLFDFPRVFAVVRGGWVCVCCFMSLLVLLPLP